MEENLAIKELEKAKSELLQKAAEIDKMINTLRSMAGAGMYGSGKREVNGKTYDKNDSLKKKVAFVISRENKFLHVQQITKYLHELEPEVSKEEFKERLTGAITALRIEGKIVRIQIDKSNQSSFWGSPKWTDKKGVVINGHAPDTDFLKKPEDIDI